MDKCRFHPDREDGVYCRKIEFGFSQGNLVTGFGLPLGKAMTGLAAGYLFQRFHVDSYVKAAGLAMLSYIPEAILTLILFRYLLPAMMGLPMSIATLIGIQIIVKAFIEMIILGVLLFKITSNAGFRSYVENYFR